MINDEARDDNIGAIMAKLNEAYAREARRADGYILAYLVSLTAIGQRWAPCQIWTDPEFQGMKVRPARFLGAI